MLKLIIFTVVFISNWSYRCKKYEFAFCCTIHIYCFGPHQFIKYKKWKRIVNYVVCYWIVHCDRTFLINGFSFFTFLLVNKCRPFTRKLSSRNLTLRLILTQKQSITLAINRHSINLNVTNFHFNRICCFATTVPT